MDKAKDIIDELKADMVAYSEHRINSRHKDNVNGMGQMFNGGRQRSIHKWVTISTRIRVGGNREVPVSHFLAH